MPLQPYLLKQGFWHTWPWRSTDPKWSQDQTWSSSISSQIMEPSVQVIPVIPFNCGLLSLLQKKVGSVKTIISPAPCVAPSSLASISIGIIRHEPGKSLAWNPVKGLVNVWSCFTWQDEDGETPATLEVFWAEARHFYGFQQTKSFTQRKWTHWQHNRCIGFKDMVEWIVYVVLLLFLVFVGASSFLKTCQQGIGQSPVPAVAVQRSSGRQDIEMQLMVPWDRFWIDVVLVCFLVGVSTAFLQISQFNFFQDSARWVKSFMKLCRWNQPFWSFAYLTPASIIYYYYDICFTYYIVT